MAAPDNTTAATRFDSFTVFRTPYKKIGDHAIDLGILVPNTIDTRKRIPILVKFHGGGLVTGDCLYPDWIASFWIPFLHRNNCIAVLPNYRLVPEHNGTDILADLADFWTWFHAKNLSNFLIEQNFPGASLALDLDYDHVLVSGDSAGGYMALMSGLTQPRNSIKAILAQYPMTGPLSRDPVDVYMDQPAPKSNFVDDHISSVSLGTVISSAIPPSRQLLSYALSAHGRYLDFFGRDRDMWPLYLVEKKEWLPPTWIVHGDSDVAVSVQDSRAFVEKARKLKGVEVVLEVREGMDHGFDIELKEREVVWLREGLKWVEEKWLE